MLNAGTAAPEGVWQGGDYLVDGVPYHLVDFLDIDKSFDVSKFCDAAREIEAAANGPLIFAGGTGMYLQGFFSGMDALPQADAALRARLKAEAGQKGKAHLHARLAEVDALSAAQIPPGNIQRVMRALEIFLLTGKPASQLRTGKFAASIPPQKAFFVYLNWDKELLNQRIAVRTELIFEPMVKEARSAIAAGYAADCPGLKSLGYREALAYLEGKMSAAQAKERIATLTRQYAKRQRTWFARYKEKYSVDINTPQDFDIDILAQRIFEKWKKQP